MNPDLFILFTSFHSDYGGKDFYKKMQIQNFGNLNFTIALLNHSECILPSEQLVRNVDLALYDIVLLYDCEFYEDHPISVILQQIFKSNKDLHFTFHLGSNYLSSFQLKAIKKYAEKYNKKPLAIYQQHIPGSVYCEDLYKIVPGIKIKDYQEILGRMKLRYTNPHVPE